MTTTATDSRRVRDTLDQLWRSGRTTSLERVAVVEEAVAALLLGDPHDPSDAVTAAHKLAGTLGMFGLPGGSELAREIEIILSGDEDPGALAHELSELVVGLRESVESAGDASEPGAADDDLESLHLVGPDNAWFEALRIGAEPRGWSARQVSHLGELPATDVGVVIVAVPSPLPDRASIDRLRRAGSSLVVACDASTVLTDRLALVDAGFDAVVGAGVGPERLFELVANELGRRNRTTRVGVAGLTGADHDRLAARLDGWDVVDLVPDELFGPTDLPDMLVIDADALGTDPVRLCRALLSAVDRDRAALFPIVGESFDPSELTTLLSTGVAGVVHRSEGMAPVAERLRSLVALGSRTTAPSDRPRANGDPVGDAIEDRVRTARRSGDRLSILFVVPRELEAVNARDGRDAGNALLARVGSVLAASFRTSDVIGRWGAGHVVALNADRLTAADRLATLASELDRSGVPIDGTITVLGVDGDDAAALLASAGGRRRTDDDHRQRGRRILLVDDDPLIADLVTDLLRHHGHEVEVITDGQSAAELLVDPAAAAGVGLVLLDVSLPGLDGFGILRWLRRAGTVPDVPVILLTARASEEEIVTGLELGAVDHIAKPFSPLVLMSRIDRALAR